MPGPQKQFTELLPQVLVTKEQKSTLYARARAANKPVSDLVRDALDMYLGISPVAPLQPEPAAASEDEFPF